MNIIPQMRLFDESEFENLGDLERLQTVLGALDDAELIRKRICMRTWRIFTPVARNSHKWKRLYKKRTGIERMNGRIDRDYRLERHTVRGLAKMTMFSTVTFLVYMGMAKGKIERGQKENLRRLYA